MQVGHSQIQRFYWIDVLRGIAALVVVIFHYHHFYLAHAFDRGAIPPIESFPYAQFFAPMFGEKGAEVVQLFWVISGFVFAHVYFSRSATIQSFAIARFARLYPLHFATLVYVAVLQSLSMTNVGHWQIFGNNDLWHFVLQVFLSSNWPTFVGGLSFNGPIWSVSLEVLIYFAFFCALVFLKRAPLATSVLLLLFFWVWVGFVQNGLWFISKGVFECGGYFFLGTFIYSLKPFERPLTLLALIFAGALVATFGSVLDSSDLSVPGEATVALCCFILMDRLFPHFGKRLRFMGSISYSVYLVHVPLQMTVLLIADVWFDGTRAFADSKVTLPVYVASSVLLAIAAHKWIELPIGSFLKAGLGRRTTKSRECAQQF